MSETCLGEVSSIRKRKKTRRGKRWRLEEKRKFTNEYMKQRKHRVAPSNTTQFLMEDREKIEPILNLSPSSSISSTDEENDFGVDGGIDYFNEQFFLKDFETTYRQLQRDNLYSLSKIELLEKVKHLESQRDNLEKEKELCCRITMSDTSKSIKEQKGGSNSLEKEFLQLQKENDSLRQENITLKQSATTH